MLPECDAWGWLGLSSVRPLDMLLPRLALVIRQLRQFEIEHQDVPRLSNTQKQLAKLITVIVSSIAVYLLKLMGAVGRKANVHLDPGKL